MKNGGARPGAGRKRKTETHGTAIAQAEARVRDNLPQLIDNMFDLANGVSVEESGKDGKARVYTRPPCRASNEYLINRVMGKPVERRETSEIPHVLFND